MKGILVMSRVDVAVWRGNHQRSAILKNAGALADEPAGIRDVFDSLKGNHYIDLPISKWNLRGIPDLGVYSIFSPRMSACLFRNIDADHACCTRPLYRR